MFRIGLLASLFLRTPGATLANQRGSAYRTSFMLYFAYEWLFTMLKRYRAVYQYHRYRPLCEQDPSLITYNTVRLFMIPPKIALK